MNNHLGVSVGTSRRAFPEPLLSFVHRIGVVTEDARLMVESHQQELLSLSLAELVAAWNSPILTSEGHA